MALLASRRGYLLAALVGIAISMSWHSVAGARLLQYWSYDNLFNKSDLVVIAKPINKTTDTKEKTFYDGIIAIGPDNRESKVGAIGVETKFSVIKTIKGPTSLQEFTLHHLRPADMGPSVNGQTTVSFDPADQAEPREYLMFLVQEPDGRYAPCGGQNDPGIFSIRALTTPHY